MFTSQIKVTTWLKVERNRFYLDSVCVVTQSFTHNSPISCPHPPNLGMSVGLLPVNDFFKENNIFVELEIPSCGINSKEKNNKLFNVIKFILVKYLYTMAVSYFIFKILIIFAKVNDYSPCF